VDCQYTWSEWSACDKSNGTQKRSPNISVQSAHGGRSCPEPETRNCRVDCEYSWAPWSACSTTHCDGQQYRDPQVSVKPLNGGAGCPARQWQSCNGSCFVNTKSRESGKPPADQLIRFDRNAQMYSCVGSMGTIKRTFLGKTWDGNEGHCNSPYYGGHTLGLASWNHTNMRQNWNYVDGTMPANTGVHFGNEDGDETFVICAGYVDGKYQTGKTHAGWQHCNIENYGREVNIRPFYYLTLDNGPNPNFR
jgi:hypothetical protein